jgi:hypothetical protein
MDRRPDAVPASGRTSGLLSRRTIVGYGTDSQGFAMREAGDVGRWCGAPGTMPACSVDVTDPPTL